MWERGLSPRVTERGRASEALRVGDEQGQGPEPTARTGPVWPFSSPVTIRAGGQPGRPGRHFQRGCGLPALPDTPQRGMGENPALP